MSIRELEGYLAAREGKSTPNALVERPGSVAIEKFVTLRELGDRLSSGFISLGTSIANEELAERYVRDGMDRGEAERYVNGQGIEIRHRLLRRDQNVIDDREEVAESLIEAGRYLIQRALEETGWDRVGIDRVYFSAAYPPLDQEMTSDSEDHWSRRIVKDLTPSAEIKFIHLACGGVGFAFVDALKDENLKGKRVLIVSLEAIQSSVEPGDIAPEVVFTDGGGVLAFNTGDFDIPYAEAVVIPDRTPIDDSGTVGVIRSPITFKMPQPDTEVPLPDWVRAAGVSPKDFVYTRHGAAIQLPRAKGKYTRMDGIPTALLFQKFALEGIQAAMAWAKDNEGLLGGPVTQVYCHQPSFPVLRGLALKSRSVLIHNGEVIKRDNLKGEELDKAPRFKWVGKYGNASSRETILSLMDYFEKLSREEVELGESFLLSSFGAGSVFVTAIIKPVT